MNAQAQDNDTHPPIRREVATATFGDIRHALRAGWSDFAARPALSLFFGIVYALFGGCMLAGLVMTNQLWLAMAAAVGFPLVAPFLAAGLYEMSRRMTQSEPFTARDIFLVIFRQRRREFGWMAFVVLFVFWIWAYQVRLLLAIILQGQSFSSLSELTAILFTTGAGITFLIVGSAVGAVLATVLFSITVVAMPLLLDKDVDVVTAMITSVKSVVKSPSVMIGWGALIGALIVFSIVTIFAGVVFIFPLLGHASWHLYERLVTEA